MININGGTVTNLGTASYRITLPNLTFTGGSLTSAQAAITAIPTDSIRCKVRRVGRSV